MFLFSSYLSRFFGLAKHCLIALVLVSSLPIAAQASCSAFPVLSKIVKQVTVLQETEDALAAGVAGHEINTLRAKLTRTDIGETLQTFGYERKLDDILRLKVKLGALSQLAIVAGPEKVKPFVNGSGFQRSFLVAKNLVDEFCTQTETSEPSNWASAVFSITTGSSLSTRNGLAPPAVGGLVLVAGILFVITLGSVLFFRSKRAQKMARANRRVACDLPVAVTIGGQKIDLNIVDLSMGGANLKNQLALEISTMAKINLGTTTRQSTVTWSNANFGGVAFHHALTADEFAAVLAQPSNGVTYEKEKRDTHSGIARSVSEA